VLTRQALEKFQVLIYLAAILCGLLAGARLPDHIGRLEALLWPVLGLLLYATFTQVPLAHLPEAFADFRFLGAAVLGNFLVLPIVVWHLVWLAPADAAVRLGILLVLVVPCTDWFITFTKLGGGDARRAIAFSPVSLLLQIMLLPVYLWVFFGGDFAVSLAQREMVFAFVGLILTPLAVAFLTEKWVERNHSRVWLVESLAWLPVPLLAVVVFIIAATQVSMVMGSVTLLARVLLVYVAFLVIAAFIALLLGKLFRLPPFQGRVLAFSLGTRNSFVVLPLALALPSSFELAVVVIVFQSLVELFGMVAYLWLVPNRLFPLTS
jgi:arsenite transporter